MKYADYFAKRADYTATWNNGDRVSGFWNNIPFVGSVGCDTLLDIEAGGRVTVFPDLPILYHDKLYKVIVVRPWELTARKSR